MNSAKQLKPLKNEITTTGEWLGLSREDEILNETKAEFVTMLRAEREKRGLTQADLARRLGMQQSAIGRIESGGPATLDVLMRCLLAVGLPSKEIAEGMARAAARVEGEEAKTIRAAREPASVTTRTKRVTKLRTSTKAPTLAAR